MAATLDNRGDLEWYVLSDGKSPPRVLISRRDAIFQLTKDFLLTAAERKRVDVLWEKGMKVGESILLVKWKNNPDRTLTRAVPPAIGAP